MDYSVTEKNFQVVQKINFNCNKGECNKMANISTRKRGNTWEYSFEIASVDGKRKRKSKGGFRTKKECIAAGIQAKAEYDSGGNITDCGNISYSDF